MNRFLTKLFSHTIRVKELRHYYRKKYMDCREIERKFTKPSKCYEQLIVNAGCGNSGSSAVIDYLKEFSDDCTVVGAVDPDSGETSTKLQKIGNMEVDFLRASGGVFELECLIESDSDVFKNSGIKRLITLSEYLFVTVGDIYNEEYLRLTREFIDKLVAFRLESEYIVGDQCMLRLSEFPSNVIEKHNLETPFVNAKNKHYFYYLKKMTKKEYRAIAKEYIKNFFNTIESNKKLVIDAVAGACQFDMERAVEYFGDIKFIHVIRDPRDVYANAIRFNDYGWLPLNVDNFISWYKDKVVHKMSFEHERMLHIRFEDFVVNYDDTAKKINEFVGLNRENQRYYKQCFVPELSIKNVGIYKNYENQKIMQQIKRELGEYCYEL